MLIVQTTVLDTGRLFRPSLIFLRKAEPIQAEHLVKDLVQLVRLAG
jgi:hypothetical protein